MISKVTAKFRKNFEDLPKDVQLLAWQAYQLWLQNPWHSSLQFKQVNPRRPYYSVRVGAHWRAIGLKSGNEIIWFWIGSHAEYDNLLKQM